MNPWKRTLAIAVLVQFVTAAGFSSTFPFLSLYIEDLGSSTGFSLEFLTGLVFSAQPLAQMLVAPVWGALADRHGRKLMVERATFGGALCIFLMAFARSAEDLIALRALQGIVAGVLSAITALVAANVPRDKVGYALGLLQVGFWGGISLGPMVGGFIADTFGFRAAFLATSALITLGGVTVLLGIDEHFKPPPRAAEKSRQMWTSWRNVLAGPGVRAIYMGDFLSQLARSMFLPFLPFFVLELLADSNRAASITGLISGISAFTGTLGAVLVGRLGDQIGHRRTLIVGAIVSAAAFVPQALITGVWQLVVLQALAGAAAGGIMPSLSAMLAHSTQPGQEGAVYGLENSIAAASRAIAPLIGSTLMILGDVRGVFMVTGLVYGVMAVLSFRWLPRVSREGNLC